VNKGITIANFSVWMNMETITQSTIAMLAVINPFVCGAMLLQTQTGETTKSKIFDAIKAMLTVLIILLIAALGGHYILKVFGISMDAFKIVGGVIISFIGFQMLVASKSDSDGTADGLKKLIMFAASPGSIAMVITLAVVHNQEDLPVIAISGVTIAVAITLAIMILMLLLLANKKPGGQAMFSQFMGLIIVAMGLQFMLDGIKHFFTL
jgi:multiple antibiotic resistance protein